MSKHFDAIRLEFNKNIAHLDKEDYNELLGYVLDDIHKGIEIPRGDAEMLLEYAPVFSLKLPEIISWKTLLAGLAEEEAELKKTRELLRATEELSRLLTSPRQP
jgi:hypothetical protein